MSKKSQIITKKSEKFLEEYLNNASPTGFESKGQQLWLDYIQPYIDDKIIDTYGSVVGIINPKAKYKVVIEAHAVCQYQKNLCYFHLLLHHSQD